MNKNDIVRKTDGTKNGGRVRYVCCFAATSAGGKACDKKLCQCPVQDYCFVEWPATSGGGTFSCPQIELELDVPAETGLVDQMIADAPQEKDTSLADKEKELAAQYDKIKAATPAFDFHSYNYGSNAGNDKPRRTNKTLV